MERFYPPVSPDAIKPLKVIRRQLDEDPDYLDSPDCPYDAEIKAFLKKEAAPKPENSVEERSVDDLEAEISSLMKELNDYGESLSSADASEKNTYFRLKASLTEKLLAMKERAVGLKQVKTFTELVLNVMEDELDPDTRTRVIRRLKDTLETD